MPIYEYYSPDTHTIYQFFARSLSLQNQLPRCPHGDTYKMEKLVSQFAVTKNRGDSEADENGLPAGMDDAKMEAAFAQLEHEFAGVDEADMSPKDMGRMMRRIEEVGGIKLPDSMREMMSRLEAGDDPEALEESLGEEMENLEGFDFATTQKLRKIMGQSRGPKRDPNLYDLNDWL